jgi:hypothetical protein
MKRRVVKRLESEIETSDNGAFCHSNCMWFSFDDFVGQDYCSRFETYVVRRRRCPECIAAEVKEEEDESRA